ncbi:acetate kinase [Ascidiimonas aurantiaca]|uniref:acetate/propionate family kinase n=1 Tax=Ascidiimonas aurantiaca TaxID=1685432 RepID=UPI0030EDBA92
MKILVINSGSSSVKYQIIEMPGEHILCKGMAERIGSPEAVLHHKTTRGSEQKMEVLPDHKTAIEKITALLTHPDTGVLQNVEEIEAVGHRVVHGGSAFEEATLINEIVKQKIREFFPLAPLHNPHNLEGIEQSQQFFPAASQVAVFDTAFHNTIPLLSRKYAIPETLFKEHGIQMYGFHGISHKYVTEKAVAFLEKGSSGKLISVHLGNGCSMTAVKDGKSIDHSLGFSTSTGLIMGSRSGDIDHAIVFYLVNSLGYTLDEVNTLLTRKSGMLGLTGFNDLRDIEKAATNGDRACLLALEMNAYRIKKYIGAYTAAMNGLNAVIFTAGIGENSSLLRSMICQNMDYLGMEIDSVKNKSKEEGICDISAANSKVRILVIPTNEELEIAKQVHTFLQF